MSMTDDRPRAPRGMPGAMSSGGGKADIVRRVISTAWAIAILVVGPAFAAPGAVAAVVGIPFGGGDLAPPHMVILSLAFVVAAGFGWWLVLRVQVLVGRIADSRARRR